MKFKFNLVAIAGAALLSAMAGSASAAIVSPVSQNGSLVLIAWDTAGPATQSYAFNTGLTLNDVLGTPSSMKFNIGGSSVFQSFFGADANPGSSSIQYTLLAGDSLSVNQRLVSTGPSAPGWMAGDTNVSTITNWLDQMATNLNPAASGYVQPNGVEYTMNDMISGNGNLLPGLFNIVAPNGGNLFGTLGDTLNVYSTVSAPCVQQGRICVPSPSTVTQLAGMTFELQNNGELDFNVSAVPEPNAFWLMGAGLAAFAVYGRRRRAA